MCVCACVRAFMRACFLVTHCKFPLHSRERETYLKKGVEQHICYSYLILYLFHRGTLMWPVYRTGRMVADFSITPVYRGPGLTWRSPGFMDTCKYYRVNICLLLVFVVVVVRARVLACVRACVRWKTSEDAYIKSFSCWGLTQIRCTLNRSGYVIFWSI